MLDAKSLLEKFLGPDAAGRAAGGVQQASNAANQMMGRVGLPTSGMGGLAVGAGAAGLLGLLLGGKGVGKVARYGGAAALGALAYRAFQNYQGQPAPAPAAPDVPMTPPPQYLPGAAPAADGTPFELALIRAMVGAAKADGHIDAAEQTRIFDAVERAGLDAEAKAFVFDVLNKPADPAAIAAAATTREQAAELYLASRMAIDPDNPAERAYLDALTHRLNLPQPLVAQLDAQVQAAG